MTTRLDVKHASRTKVRVARGDATNSQQTLKIDSMDMKLMFEKLDALHESHGWVARLSFKRYLDSTEHNNERR